MPDLNSLKSLFVLRDARVDFYRGVALINMVFYHLVFDLQLFGMISFGVFDHPYGMIWRGFIIFLFLVCVGISLTLSSAHRLDLDWKKTFFSKSNLYLLIGSVIVSVSTYFVFPQAWVYFGILHFILLCKYICVPFTRLPRVSLALAILIMILFYFVGAWNPFMSYVGMGIIPPNTVDVVNVLPWLSVVLLGIFLGHYSYYKKFPVTNNSMIAWCGRHSLVIYLAHQAVLFPIVWGVYYLTN